MHRRNEGAAPIQIIGAGQRPREPWKNGGGFTTEIARSSEGDATQWRVSIADLESDAMAFSTFAGWHRIFTPIGPTGVRLQWVDAHIEVEPLQPTAFDGGQPPTCIPYGPTRAFNVMAKTAASSEVVVAVRRLNGSGATAELPGTSVLYVHSGRIHAPGWEAVAGDCAIVGGHGTRYAGDAVVVEASASGRTWKA